jgi:predicted metal-binding membrane protein
LLLAGVAWAGTFVVVQQMGVMAGTMGLAMPAFLSVWLLMMVAMMLPAVTPVARLYLRTIGRDRRALRVAGFLSGYLLVWTAADFPHSAWPGARSGSQLNIQERPGWRPPGLFWP